MKHFNPSISEDKTRILNIKSGDDNSDVADFIQPTLEITPKINLVKRAEASNSTSATIYTTPTDKDTYIVALMLTMIKDINATSVSSRIYAYIDGVSSYLAEITGFVTTVQEKTIFLSFPIPIKIDRGTALTVTNTTNVANCKSSAIIYGYTRETLKGV